MTRSDPTAWTRLAFDSWALSVDAASVIWLRSLRLMAGGKLAEREAERMVKERWSRICCCGHTCGRAGRASRRRNSRAERCAITAARSRPTAAASHAERAVNGAGLATRLDAIDDPSAAVKQ